MPDFGISYKLHCKLQCAVTIAVCSNLTSPEWSSVTVTHRMLCITIACRLLTVLLPIWHLGITAEYTEDQFFVYLITLVDFGCASIIHRNNTHTMRAR